MPSWVRTITKASPRRIGFSAFAALTGKRSASPRSKAVQKLRTGQTRQEGERGVQIVAPRSIIA